MLGKTNKRNKEIVSAMCIILAIATVFSLGSTVFAADSNDEVASWKTFDTAVIKGSENVPEISVKSFLMNTFFISLLFPFFSFFIVSSAVLHFFFSAVYFHPFLVLLSPGWHHLFMISISAFHTSDLLSHSFLSFSLFFFSFI